MRASEGPIAVRSDKAVIQREEREGLEGDLFGVERGMELTALAGLAGVGSLVMRMDEGKA